MKNAVKLALALSALQLASTAMADQRFVSKLATAPATSTTCGFNSNTADTVNGPCLTFSQAYINGAAAGGTVILLPLSDGTFIETLNLNVPGQNVQIFTTSNIHPELRGPSGANAINVALGDNDAVQIFNTFIVGGGNTANVGINVTNARSLQLHNVTMRAFAQQAILFQPNNASIPSHLGVFDSDIGDVTGACVSIAPKGSTSSGSEIRNSIVHNCGNGIKADGSGTSGQARAGIDSTFIGNVSGNGVSAVSGAKMMVDSSQIRGAGANGVLSNGAGSSVVLHHSTVAANTTGSNPVGGGSVLSTGDNIINFNGANGSWTTIGLQ